MAQYSRGLADVPTSSFTINASGPGVGLPCSLSSSVRGRFGSWQSVNSEASNAGAGVFLARGGLSSGMRNPKRDMRQRAARAGQKPSVPRASDPSLHDREHVLKSSQVKFRNLTKTIEVTPALTPAPSHRTAPLPSVNTSTVLSTRSLGLRIQCSRIQFRVVRSVSQYSGWSAGPMGGPWCSCWRDCVRQSGGGWGRGEGGGGCVNRRHTSAVVSLAIEHAAVIFTA